MNKVKTFQLGDLLEKDGNIIFSEDMLFIYLGEGNELGYIKTFCFQSQTIYCYESSSWYKKVFDE